MKLQCRLLTSRQFLTDMPSKKDKKGWYHCLQFAFVNLHESVTSCIIMYHPVTSCDRTQAENKSSGFPAAIMQHVQSICRCLKSMFCYSHWWQTWHGSPAWMNKRERSERGSNMLCFIMRRFFFEVIDQKSNSDPLHHKKWSPQWHSWPNFNDVVSCCFKMFQVVSCCFILFPRFQGPGILGESSELAVSFVWKESNSDESTLWRILKGDGTLSTPLASFIILYLPLRSWSLKVIQRASEGSKMMCFA